MGILELEISDLKFDNGMRDGRFYLLGNHEIRNGGKVKIEVELSYLNFSLPSVPDFMIS